MRQRLELAESRVPSYNMRDVMPEDFHRLNPDFQRLRVREGLEAGRFTDDDMRSLLRGGDVGEIVGPRGKPRTAMQGALGQESPLEEAMRLSEEGRAAEMERIYDAGGTMGNFNQQGFGRPEDAATRAGTFYQPNVAGSAIGGFFSPSGYTESLDRTLQPYQDRGVRGATRGALIISDILKGFLDE